MQHTTAHVTTRSNKTIPTALAPIAAGPAVEIADEFYELDVSELITKGHEGYMAYEVTGDSRAPEIQPGNLVFVNTLLEPRNGSLIAARINGLVCVKEFQITHRHLRLVSSNEKYPPRDISEQDDFQILGVVKWHLGSHD